jgi:hypothetical protein
MEKYYREINGERYVGVVISSGFGAGWSTWGGQHPCDKDFIEYLLKNGIVKKDDDSLIWTVNIAQSTVEAYYPNEETRPYCGGADGLEIHWVKEGTVIRIAEYDGNESIEYLSEAGFFEV